MPFLSPNQQYQSTEGKNITFHGLVYPKLTWGLPTFSLTTNSSWLSWGRVASGMGHTAQYILPFNFLKFNFL